MNARHDVNGSIQVEPLHVIKTDPIHGHDDEHDEALQVNQIHRATEQALPDNREYELERIESPHEETKSSSGAQTSNSDNETFGSNGFLSSHDQWNKILNLQVNLHSIAQANLVAQTQERIAKEYGIETPDSNVKNNILDPKKKDDQKEYTAKQPFGKEENNKEKGLI